MLQHRSCTPGWRHFTPRLTHNCCWDESQWLWGQNADKPACPLNLASACAVNWKKETTHTLSDQHRNGVLKANQCCSAASCKKERKTTHSPSWFIDESRWRWRGDAEQQHEQEERMKRTRGGGWTDKTNKTRGASAERMKRRMHVLFNSRSVRLFTAAGGGGRCRLAYARARGELAKSKLVRFSC